MKKHPPIDADGKDLRIGDWVRVLAVPLSIKDMPAGTKEAFSKAVGNTFQIEAFDEMGCVELDMWPKVSTDTIWLEPYCVRRSRRYKRLSKAFRRKLEENATPPPPRYELKFTVRLKEGVDIEAFGHRLLGHGWGGAFASHPNENRIEGFVHADKSDPDAVAMLEEAHRFVLESEQVSDHEMGEIAEANDTQPGD